MSDATKPRFTKEEISSLFEAVLAFLDEEYDVYYDDGDDSLGLFGNWALKHIVKVDQRERASEHQSNSDDGKKK